MHRNSIVIDKKDNVATALRQLETGESIETENGGQVIKTVISRHIPSGHKYALENIRKGQVIIKYGETIGLATEDIPQGSLVHVHNVEGLKGRGDKR